MHWGGHLDIITLDHMHSINTRGDAIRYCHHKAIIFTLPNVERTTVTNKRNWNCDRRIIRTTVIPREEQLVADEDVEYDEKGGDDDDEEEGDVDAGHGGPEPEGIHAEEAAIPPPSPPLYPPFSNETGGSSSSVAAYMPLDPALLQSFSNLQMEISGLWGYYTGMRDDLHRLSGHMDFIEEGVSYFRNFVERQEERERRRIQREEERAMREAQEYKERRRMNELLWRPSESIMQLDEGFRTFPSGLRGLSSFPSYDPSHSSTFHPFPPHFWPSPEPDGTQ